MSAFERLLRPLKVRIAGMVTRGLLKLVTESDQFELLQVRIYGGDDESPQDNVEHFQPFGFSSKAAPGAIPLLLTLGGSRAHTVAVCVADPRYRPRDLAEGEAALYSRWGDEVRVKQGSVGIASASVDISGNLSTGTGATTTMVTPTGQVVTLMRGVVVKVMEPGDPVPLNLEYFEGLMGRINNASSCADLQAAAADVLGALGEQASTISDRLAFLAPLEALTEAPTDLGGVIDWIGGVITNVIQPLYTPVAGLTAQSTALEAQLAAVTAAIAAKAAAFPDCSVPPA